MTPPNPPLDDLSELPEKSKKQPTKEKSMKTRMKQIEKAIQTLATMGNPALLEDGRQLYHDDRQVLKYCYNVLLNCAEKVSDNYLAIYDPKPREMAWYASRPKMEVQNFKAILETDKQAVEALAERLLGPLRDTWTQLKFDPATGDAISCD
jgi:hypothetical protein